MKERSIKDSFSSQCFTERAEELCNKEEDRFFSNETALPDFNTPNCPVRRFYKPISKFLNIPINE